MLALFNALTLFATNTIPYALVCSVELLVTIKRFGEVLKEEEQEIRELGKTVPRLALIAVSAKWEGTSENGLKNVSMNCSPGKFTCVLGPVGAGKSTLLHTILGETQITSGVFKVEGSVAFTAQNPCLFPGTVRENITFGASFNPIWYDSVVKACALVQDFQLLPFGDASLVGDMGVTLSGGQKCRISLARAIYRNADIYLLDDPLSSVDVATGQYIYNHSIRGLLKSKCVILVTHQTQFSVDADEIIILKNGSAFVSGGYARLTRLGHLNDLEVTDGVVDNIMSTVEFTEMKIGSNGASPHQEVESKEEGRIRLGVLLSYMRAGNGVISVSLMIFFFIANQAVLSGTDIFLQQWIQGEEDVPVSQELASRNFYIFTYTALMAPIVLMPIITNLTYNIVTIRSMVQLHRGLFKAIMYASMAFFEVTPKGQILNRFSKDMGSCDVFIPEIFLFLAPLLLMNVGIIVVVSIMSPYLILAGAILFLSAGYVHKFYLNAASTISRLETISKSPVISRMAISMYGLSTIRAFRMEHQFGDEFDKCQNTHSSAFFSQTTVIRWFSVTVQLIAAIYYAVIIIYFMFNHADSSIVGLCVSTAINLSNSLSVVLAKSTDLENRLVSVERILEYSNLRPEGQEHTQKRQPRLRMKPTAEWPSKGKVQFRNVTAEYITGRPVLSGISCSFQPHEKIGIVGRTGAGKTTLVSAIFRSLELLSGSIHIDGVDISKVDIYHLRSKLGIVPQDPILFKGKLRTILDPLEEHSDYALYQALKDCMLSERIAEAGLDTEVDEGGSNFSHGERQLISLTRAMLRKVKILVLDESTAHLDSSSEEIIRSLVNTLFCSVTVIIIAHRLQTVLDADRICVMEAGKILEFDTPQRLLNIQSSHLFQLVKKGKLIKS